ncbi:MAG: UPF0280 family protein [Sphaerochaeta sp.]
MYQRRTYRRHMGGSRFSSLSFSIGESDLWIGYQGDCDRTCLQKEAVSHLRRLRGEILGYPDQRFFTSFVPFKAQGDLTPLLASMFESGKKAGTGPMASVAGAIAEALGRHLKEQFNLCELVVENGGDLYIDVQNPLPIQLFAPTSALSGKFSIIIDPSYGPMGVCTSSGTLGHSASLGKADAVMVACTNASLADAYATAYCNQIQGKEDVKRVCEAISALEEVVSAVVVCEDMVAVGGCLEVGT